MHKRCLEAMANEYDHGLAVRQRDRLLEALKGLLDYANAYSDEMRKHGLGAGQLGENADSCSVAGMARAAIASVEQDG